MPHDQIDALARQAGCLPEAVPDIRARVQAHFPEADVSPQAVERWLVQTLKAEKPELFSGPQPLWTQLGLDKATFDQMPASWRLAQAHQQTPPTTTPHPNRPVYRHLTSAELAELDGLGLTGAARHEWARARQQTPAPQS
jgi:hypothetical protein